MEPWGRGTMSRVSNYERYVAPRAGYGGNPDPKTDYCSVCSRRRPVGEALRPVTFRATWTELLPRDKAEAVGEGNDFTEIAVDRLWVTRVEERMPSTGHPRPGDRPVLTVHMTDRPPRELS